MKTLDLNTSCNNYFQPNLLWKKGLSGKFKAVGAVLSYVTIVVPIIVKVIQHETKKKINAKKVEESQHSKINTQRDQHLSNSTKKSTGSISPSVDQYSHQSSPNSRSIVNTETDQLKDNSHKMPIINIPIPYTGPQGAMAVNTKEEEPKSNIDGQKALPPNERNDALALDLSQKGLNTFPEEVKNLTQLRTLNLSGNQLSSLPPKLDGLKELRKLDLSNNPNLSHLPMSLGRIPELIEIDIDGTNISFVERDIILQECRVLRRTLKGQEALKNFDLQELNLQANELTVLPPEIGNLTKLKDLYLGGNKLRTLPTEMGKLINLEALYISQNNLQALPPEIGNLTNLKELGLEFNQLKALPQEIGNLANLHKLRLRQNGLKNLPPEIGNLANLKELSILQNSLQTLPPDIGNLANLEELNLDDNKLQALPPEIGKLANLQELFIIKNDLQVLPPEIGGLANLQKLDLSGNQLQSLPSEIGNLVKLQSLILDRNILETLPVEIGNLANLKLLGLAGNKLQTLPPEIRNFANLEDLILSQNSLQALPPEIGNLVKLQSLILDRNKLETLPPEIGNFANLEHLFLSENSLKALPSEIGNLIKLELLVLSDNQLSSLPSGLGGLSALQRLDLSNNPNLRELPLSLGQLPSLIEIEIEGTGISIEQRDSILRQCKALREREALEVFPERLEAWKIRSKEDFDLSEILKYDDLKIGIMNEWLVRLENTSDFRTQNQEALAKLVMSMLVATTTNKEFNEHFFVQAEINNSDCQDRAAMALNEIYTGWKLTELPKDTSIKQKIELLSSGAKTIALRRLIAQEIDKHQKETGRVEQESVEIYLYYETELQRKLNLLSAVATMGYEAVGRRDWINENQLLEQVNKNYLDELAKLDVLGKLFDNSFFSDTVINDAFKEKVDPIEAQIYKWYESKPNDPSELSAEFLDWKSKLTVLNKERDNAVTNLKKQWAQRQLGL